MVAEEEKKIRDDPGKSVLGSVINKAEDAKNYLSGMLSRATSGTAEDEKKYNKFLQHQEQQMHASQIQ